MTFPSPFDTPEPPGADQAFALQAEHGQAIQAIADRLYQAGVEGQKRLKTTLATGIKGKLVRPAAREQKANSQERTRIAAQMRHDGEISQANNDAEIMRLAPRLGAYEAEAARMQSVPGALVAQAVLPGGGPSPPIPRPPPSQPGAIPPQAIPPPNPSLPCYPPRLLTMSREQCRENLTSGWLLPHDAPPWAPPAPVCPPGYDLYWTQLVPCWLCCGPGDGGPPPTPPPPGPPPPPPIPPPVPPPVPPPCPPGQSLRCTPDGIPIIGPPVCPQGPPHDAAKVAVYVVPWLEPGDTVPSAYSECGRKVIADGLAQRYPAQALLDALAVPGGISATYKRQPPPGPDSVFRE